MYGMYCMYFNVFTSIVMYRKNGMYCTLYYVLIYLPSIDWYHYKIHAKYLHNTYQYIPRYMPKRVYEAKTRVLHRSCISMYLPLLSGMYWGMYWYVFYAQHTRIGIYCGVYWYLLGKYWRVLKHNTRWSQPRGLYCSTKYCCMYQCVLICICMYEPVYACIGSQIDCKHSNLGAYCTSIHF